VVENPVAGSDVGLCDLVVFVDETAKDRSSSDAVMSSRELDHVWVVGGCTQGHVVALVAAADVVKSVRGAVLALSTGPFPRTASRTRRAPFRAPGAPQVPFGSWCWFSSGGWPGRGNCCAPVSVACRAYLGGVE
jgi:hypothetical protein